MARSSTDLVEERLRYNAQYPNLDMKNPIDKDSTRPLCTTSASSHSHSINTIPSLHPDYIVSEDLLAGQRSQGRMSAVRRFFCMFVTFDLLFTGFLWIVSVMLTGGDIMTAFSEQVLHYDIHTSLFDIVAVALCRFVVLFLFYGLFYLNHWIAIALSTSLSCAFLIAKVFVYNWPHSSQPVFEVLVILVSFVVSWGEAWFLDFRVLPHESNASRYLITNVDSERAPLIRNHIHGQPPPSLYTESIGNFYSPMQSPEGSVHRLYTGLAGPILGDFPRVELTREQEEFYRDSAIRVMQEAWDILHRKDWKFEKVQDNDTVYSATDGKSGKIYKLSAVVDVPPKFLLDEMFYRIDHMSEWYPALMETHKVQVLDERTDISYQISANAAGGVVSSRDFVNLRQWDLIDNVYILASASTEHPSVPVKRNYIRGENGTGCYAMQIDPTDPNRCLFHWVVNTNLKGWVHIPQKILEPGYINMMFEFINHLRVYVDRLRESGLITANADTQTISVYSMDSDRASAGTSTSSRRAHS